MLTILDPTSLLGGEILGRLVRGRPSARPRLFHTGAEPEHLIAEIAGEPVIVAPLTDLDELERSTTIVVTARPAAEAMSERLLAWLRAHPRISLVDGTQPGVAGAEGRCVTAGVAPPVRPSLPWYHLADPALAAPAHLLAALAPLAPESARLTLLDPAAGFGAEALDELAAQGAARLSGNPKTRAIHLPGVLAFDLAPAPATRSSGLEAQLAELFPGLETTVTAIDAGVFHGHLATVVVTCRAAVTTERARTLLRSVPGLRLLRRNETTTVSAAVRHGGIACGGLDVGGRTVSAWLCADGLRVGGAEAVVDLLTALNAS
jgi:hypothetical protein